MLRKTLRAVTAAAAIAVLATLFTAGPASAETAAQAPSIGQMSMGWQ